MGKVRVMQKQFRDYYQSILQAEIDSRKTEKGKTKYKEAMKQGLSFIDKNNNALYFAIASHITLGECKNTLVRKMNQIQSIGHFLRTENGQSNSD